MAPSRKHERLAVAGVALLLLVHLSYYFPRVVDDAFISLRYAEHLAHGDGAVYNVGEKVEGYSSPSWLFVQTLAVVLHIEPVTFGKLVGVLCLFATAWGVRQVAREMYGVTSWHSFVPPFLVAMSSYVVDWSILGLETPLHVATIVLAPLLVHRALHTPSRKTRIWAAVALVTLGTTRPESPLYVVICVLAPLAFEPRTKATLVSAARFVVPAGVALAVLLLVRRSYYGEWLPNTYFVKGAHESFDPSKLEDLWSHGTRVAELLQTFVGSAALVYFSWRQRVLTPALLLLADLWFTASVRVDWMPSLRHLLPVLVLAPIGSARGLEELVRSGHSAARAGVLLVCANAGWDTARVDSRLSTLEVDEVWISTKELGKWSDTFKAYRRIAPEHVAKMKTYNMGQITQCWPVLDTSQEPIHDTWYAGRDIGAVGYLTEVKVWDTAGLVTREVSRDPRYSREQLVSEELLEQMFAKRPVAVDLFEGWDAAAARRSATWLRYAVTMGDVQAPRAILAIDRQAPSSEERLRRYRVMASRLPRLFHLHTLYGESLGAVVEKRLAVVENEERRRGVTH